MPAVAWSALLAPLALAGCLQASVFASDPPPASDFVPTLQVMQDDREAMLVVHAVGAGFTWDGLGIQADQDGTRVSVATNDGERTVAPVPTDSRPIWSSPGQIHAGEVLRFCAVGEARGPVEYVLVHSESATVKFQGTFPEVPACA